MPLNVHLVFAGITHGGFSSWGKSGEYTLINHGLALLGASLQASGHHVTLTHLRACSGWDDFKKRIAQSHPDVVGLTMLSCDFDPVLQAARMVKEVNPMIQVVVGGPHPSLMPEEIEPYKEVDVIFRGEGEITFPRLLTKMEEGEALPRMVQGEPPDLNKIPFASRDLFPGPERPEPALNFSEPFVTIIVSRGCRYHCSFCQPAERIIFGRRVRRRSIDNVIEELLMLRKHHLFRSLMIHDDCFTEDPPWVNEFCDRYRTEGFKAPFLCQSRSDLICHHPDLIGKMRDIGLKWLIIGFESGSDRILKFLKKGTTVKQNLEAAMICRKLGIRIWANYMMGIPTETKEEVEETVEMIQKIKPDICSPSYYTPHPGSDLFAYCQEQHLSLIKSHADYTRYPSGPKIDGIDYEFLHQMVEKSCSYSRSYTMNRLAQTAQRLRIPAPIRKIVRGMLIRYKN